MTWRTAERYRSVADAAWRWILDQMRWEDGLWIPVSVAMSEISEVPDYRDGKHSGVGGLAYVLAETRLSRRWTSEEQRVAGAITERVSGGIAGESTAPFSKGWSAPWPSTG